MDHQPKHRKPEASRKASEATNKGPWIIALGSIAAAALAAAVALYIAFNAPHDHTPIIVQVNPHVPVVRNSTPTEPRSSAKLLSCSLSGTPAPGATVEATYTFTADGALSLGVGADNYGADGSSSATGEYDIESMSVMAGTYTKTRKIVIPQNLKPGSYETTVEFWAAGEVGADGFDALDEMTCGRFPV